MKTAKNSAYSLLALLGGLLVIALASSALGYPVTSFAWTGAPELSAIKPLIESAWLNNPPAAEADFRHVPSGIGIGIALGEKGGAATSVTVVRQHVRQARRARGKNGVTFTYWPADVELRTVYRRTEKVPGTEKMWETIVTKRDCTSRCFATKTEKGWEVTFEEPADITPFFKFW